MSRNKGLFAVSANYEPLIAGPFDAREQVQLKSDLISAATWEQPNGDKWIYKRMLVVVANDTIEDNNGLYILTDVDNYQSYDAWMKLADMSKIIELENKINNLDINNVQIINGGKANG